MNFKTVSQFVLPGLVVRPTLVCSGVVQRRPGHLQASAVFHDVDVLIVDLRHELAVLVPDDLRRRNADDRTEEDLRLVDDDRCVRLDVRPVDVCRNCRREEKNRTRSNFLDSVRSFEIRFVDSRFRVRRSRAAQRPMWFANGRLYLLFNNYRRLWPFR